MVANTTPVEPSSAFHCSDRRSHSPAMYYIDAPVSRSRSILPVVVVEFLASGALDLNQFFGWWDSNSGREFRVLRISSLVS